MRYVLYYMDLHFLSPSYTKSYAPSDVSFQISCAILFMFTNSPIHTIKFYLSSFQYFSAVIAIHIQTYIFSIFQWQESHSMYEANSTFLCVNIQRVQVLEKWAWNGLCLHSSQHQLFLQLLLSRNLAKGPRSSRSKQCILSGSKIYWCVFPGFFYPSISSKNQLASSNSNSFMLFQDQP